MRCFRAALVVLFAWIGLFGQAVGGDRDRYRYVLKKSTDDKVCRHMQRIYNKNFAYPWKRPAMTAVTNDPADEAYGPKGRYAFPKIPGVTHDNRMILDMSYSRLPSSPEFEAIEWVEGRYRLIGGGGPGRNELPMLVAKFDIDNDGTVDTVIKGSFMLSYYGSRGRGGEDMLLVFAKDTIDPSQPIVLETFHRDQLSRSRPALITALPGVPYRLIRPFSLEGVIYLSGYQQAWISDNVVGPEHMHVLRYRGVSESTDHLDRRNVVHLDRICEFRMKTVKPR